jgi:F0F1-type ATP synthase delta subunit
MSAVEVISFARFVLPATVVTKADVSRLVTELETVDNDLTAASVRAKAGTTTSSHPVLSDQLDTFLEQNKLALGQGRDRTTLIQQLRLLKEKVPVIHMTFAVPADGESLHQLVEWIRASVHPQAVLEVGMQPGLVAGVYLRTPNLVHDLSLRHAFEGKQEALKQALGALRG